MTSGRDAVQKSEKSTLHQLVNAIRASIGDLLEQSPNSLSACTASKLSPSTNGMVYGSNRTSVTLGSNQGVQSQLSPSTISKGCKQSQIDDRLHPFSSFPSSNSRQLSADSPVAYSSSVEVQSRNYSVHKDTTHGTSQCLTNNKATYSVENSGHMFLSNQSPLIPHSVSSQAVNLQFRSVCRNTHQNSSSVISSSNPSSRATTGVSNNSLQTRVSLSHYDLSSRQVDKIIEMLAEQAHCKTTTEECNMHSDVSLNSSRLHDNLKNVTSPGNSARAFISHTLQTDHRLNQDPMNLNPPSQHNQLNELVQILKAALHHHTSSHLPANPAAFVSTSSRQTSGSLPDSSGSHDTIKSHSMDIGVGQESKAFISTSIQDGSSFSSQTGSRTSVTNRLVSDSFPFSRINTGIDHSGSPASACNYSNVSNSAKTNEDNSEINDRRETPNAPSPTSASPSIRSGHSTNTLIDITTKSTFSPAPASENCLVLEKISDVLDSSEMKSFFTPGLISNYQDETLQRLEQEAQIESKNFDRLQSVLYGELSAESKKLRALVRISEAKLAIHKEKQTSLQELMDAIEVRKHLPNLSFVDDVL
ncbi:unnamed protein product [Heterobilharzia americana]|nr:unnamed protein product [Heterobilharzia americana]